MKTLLTSFLTLLFSSVSVLVFAEQAEEDKVTINFGKENSDGYYLTFKGEYNLYFDGDKLMMEVTYNVEIICFRNACVDAISNWYAALSASVFRYSIGSISENVCFSIRITIGFCFL